MPLFTYNQYQNKDYSICPWAIYSPFYLRDVCVARRESQIKCMRCFNQRLYSTLNRGRCSVSDAFWYNHWPWPIQTLRHHILTSLVQRCIWEFDALDFFKGTNASGRFHELACVPVNILRECIYAMEWGNGGDSLLGSSILRIAPLLQAASRRTMNSKPSLETSVTYLDSLGESLEVMVD